MNGALNGRLILDLSRFLPGPYCSMILADHGARVIALEDRRFEKGGLDILRSVNRNKEHMTLNLKTDKGREIFFSLARTADVILEGFRPGVTSRLGVDYETVKGINPGIIYCALTGYGQTGPLKDQAGHDINFVGYSGALSLIGPKDGPPCIPGLQLGDVAGGMYAAVGILMALLAREKTGKGQFIDISMTDSVLSMLHLAAGWLQAHGAPPKRGDFGIGGRYAYYNIYETRDGKYVTLAALEPQFWRSICTYLGMEEYIPHQEDEERREEMVSRFRAAFREKTREQWQAILADLDVCGGGVLDLDEALAGDNARERKMAVTLPDGDRHAGPAIGTPIKFSDTPGGIRTPPPDFGQHTEKILSELGYTPADIEALAKEGVV